MSRRAAKGGDGASNSSGASTPTATVVVPAYKEKENLRALTERLFAALKEASYDRVELVIVDDNSRDGSVEEVEQLQKEGYNARIVVRTEERGLSSAVLRGFDEAKGELLLCMDADLQHPPETVPLLLDELHGTGSHDFVLGTRYGEGTSVDKKWPLHRKVISGGARALARPLTSLTDPMSGLFGVRAEVFQRHRAKISGMGFKVGLEIYVKCGLHRHAEVPFNFASRVYGTSKLTGGVMVQYVQHLGQLYAYRSPWILILLFVLVVVAAYIFLDIVF